MQIRSPLQVQTPMNNIKANTFQSMEAAESVLSKNYGFAVVADEIKTLADNSKETAIYI